MADAIATIVTFIVTVLLAMHSNGCLTSEPVSISTEESETQIAITRDEDVSPTISSIGTTRSTIMGNRSISKFKTEDYGVMIPLSTNANQTYSSDFIDPYNIYYDYKDFFMKPEIVEIDEREVPTTNYVLFDPNDISPTNITGASSDEWDQFIDQLCDERGYDSNHFLRGKGDVLSEIESDFNINPIGLISIWVWESDIGSSYIGQTKHNLAGIRGNGDYRYFETYTECMRYHGELIRNRYLNEGLTTWQLIGEVYCPDNDEWPMYIESTVYDYNEMLYKILSR